MSDKDERKAEKRLREIRALIGKNDASLRQFHQEKLECTVALKIMKVVKAVIDAKYAETALRPTALTNLESEVETQAKQIVNYLRENI